MISYQTSGYYGMNWYPLITYTSGIAAEGIIYNVNRQPNSEIAVNFAPGGPAATSGGDGSYIETEPYSTYSAIPGEISVSSLGYRTLSSPVNSGLLLRMILAFKPGGVWARHDSHGQYHESYLPGDGSVTHNRSDTGAFSTLYAYSIFTGLISQASFHSSRRTDGHPLCYTYVTGYQGFYGFSHDDGQSVFTGTLFTGTDKVSHTNSIELATHDGTLLVWTSYITGSSGDVNIKISRLNPDTTVDGVYIIGGLSPIQFLDGQFGLTVDPLTGNPFISAIKSGDTSPTRYVSYDDGESWTDLTTTMPTSPNIGFYQEIPSGTVNGTNVTFGPLTHTPLTNSLVLLRNAEVLALGTDYTLSGATITMITAPTTTGGLTDRLYATYAYAV